MHGCCQSSHIRFCSSKLEEKLTVKVGLDRGVPIPWEFQFTETLRYGFDLYYNVISLSYIDVWLLSIRSDNKFVQAR